MIRNYENGKTKQTFKFRMQVQIERVQENTETLFKQNIQFGFQNSLIVFFVEEDLLLNNHFDLL